MFLFTRRTNLRHLLQMISVALFQVNMIGATHVHVRTPLTFVLNDIFSKTSAFILTKASSNVLYMEQKIVQGIEAMLCRTIFAMETLRQ